MLPSKFIATSGVPGEHPAIDAAFGYTCKEASYLRPHRVLPGQYNSDVWPVIVESSAWTLTQIGGGSGTVGSVLAGQS